MNDMIHKQITFLDRLRKTQAKHNFPFITKFDLNSVIKNIARERKTKLDVQKWKHFVENYNHSPDTRNGKMSENSTVKSNGREGNVLFDSRMKQRILKRNDLLVCKLHSNPEDDESNVFLEMLKFKKETEENKNPIAIRGLNEFCVQESNPDKCRIIISKGKALDFNTLLMQVKRERKRKKDEEKWQSYLKKKSQRELTQKDTIYKRLTSDSGQAVFQKAKINDSEYPKNYYSNDNKITPQINKYCPDGSLSFNSSKKENNHYCNCKLMNDNNPVSSHEIIVKKQDQNENIKFTEEMLCGSKVILNNENHSTLTTKLREDGKTTNEENIQESSLSNLDVKKLEQIIIKINTTLKSIKHLITKSKMQTLPDEDLVRIKQRTLQFGMRFKGNYSYRIN